MLKGVMGGGLVKPFTYKDILKILFTDKESEKKQSILCRSQKNSLSKIGMFLDGEVQGTEHSSIIQTSQASQNTRLYPGQEALRKASKHTHIGTISGHQSAYKGNMEGRRTARRKPESAQTVAALTLAPMMEKPLTTLVEHVYQSF